MYDQARKRREDTPMKRRQTAQGEACAAGPGSTAGAGNGPAAQAIRTNTDRDWLGDLGHTKRRLVRCGLLNPTTFRVEASDGTVWLQTVERDFQGQPLPEQINRWLNLLWAPGDTAGVPEAQ
jgi:hypothetical protein